MRRENGMVWISENRRLKIRSPFVFCFERKQDHARMKHNVVRASYNLSLFGAPFNKENEAEGKYRSPRWKSEN